MVGWEHAERQDFKQNSMCLVYPDYSELSLVTSLMMQVSMLYELMGTKKEDKEFVLQIAHSLDALLSCEATRAVLLQGTQVNSNCGCMHFLLHA